MSLATTPLRGLRPKSTSIIHHTHHTLLPSHSQVRQHLPLYRSFHTTPPCATGRDLLARFRAPPRATRIPISPTKATGADVPFETISTSPAGTSFQEVPNPALESASKITFPLPAMKEPIDASAAPSDPAMSRGVMDVLGVKVPPKPRPPGEEECCMSGCVHCVYTIYADDLVLYTSALDTALEALRKGSVAEVQWPDEIRVHAAEQDGAGKKKITEEVVVPALDPTMAAFLALESKLKKKQAPESSAATH